MVLDLWGNEIAVNRPTRKMVQPDRWGRNYDIDGWFRDNMPQTSAECADVLKALRHESRFGDYESGTCYYRTSGREMVRLKGPSSAVMIVSVAARKYLSNKIRNRERYLKVLLDQFGTEQPELQ